MALNQDYQGRSRFNLKSKAVRPALPARVLLLAPSGAGKTWTSLSIGSTLVADGGEVVMIDTEQQQGEFTSSVTYADEFDFELVPWVGTMGFDVRDLTATLRESANHMSQDDVLIIDGIQPFWSGVGGILDMVEGKFGSWSKVRPFQAAMLEAMKTHPAHLVLTCRSKLVWAVQEVEDQRGRTKQHIEMQGTGPQFDSNIVYEMNVSIQMDQDHSMQVIKSRATKFADRRYQAEQENLFAQDYKEWLAGGQPVIGRAQREAITGPFAQLPDSDRSAMKKQFAEEFGPPAQILVEDYDRALGWVEQHIGEVAPTGDGGDPDEGETAEEKAERIAAEVAAEELEAQG